MKSKNESRTKSQKNPTQKKNNILKKPLPPEGDGRGEKYKKSQNLSERSGENKKPSRRRNILQLKQLELWPTLEGNPATFTASGSLGGRVAEPPEKSISGASTDAKMHTTVLATTIGTSPKKH